jgi:antitoxin ParD1/3/4
MNIHLTPEIERLVETHVKSGRYSTADDVVLAALRLLESRDEDASQRKDKIREHIEEGWQSAQRGELVEGSESFDRFDADLEALEHIASQ